MAAWGLQQIDDDSPDTPPAPPPDKCYLWPCNVRAFVVWQQVQTQWVVGMNGRTGLNWASVDIYLSTVPALRPKARHELWAGLRAMERAALEEYAKQQNEA